MFQDTGHCDAARSTAGSASFMLDLYEKFAAVMRSV